MKKIIALAIIMTVFSTPTLAVKKENKFITASKALVTESMKDPDSVRFRNVRLVGEVSVCGEVNAKNSMGGYVGFKRFFVIGGAVLRVEDDPSEFDQISESVCSGKKPAPKPDDSTYPMNDWVDKK